MKQPTIKINNPQPIDCPQCKEKHGYQYDDYFKMHYTSVHRADGKYECGAYSEGSRTLNRGKIAYCSNCGARLPFKLERSAMEDLTNHLAYQQGE